MELEYFRKLALTLDVNVLMAVMMPAPPEPGIPKAIMQENRNCDKKSQYLSYKHSNKVSTWQKKMKKKSMKLKLESLRNAL